MVHLFLVRVSKCQFKSDNAYTPVALTICFFGTDLSDQVHQARLENVIDELVAGRARRACILLLARYRIKYSSLLIKSLRGPPIGLILHLARASGNVRSEATPT